MSPNATIYIMTNTKPLVECVRSRQLKFLGHILRMPDDEPVRLYALYTPQHGKKKPGWQSTSFLTYIQRLLGDSECMFQPDQITSLAQARKGWKKLVVACSAADRWWWLLHINITVMRSWKLPRNILFLFLNLKVLGFDFFFLLF